MNNVYASAQEGLVKSLIANPKALPDIVRFVHSDDFDDERYRLVYDSIKELSRENEEITLPGILETIINQDNSVHIDPEWILSLDNDLTKWVVKAPAISWAKILKNESARFKTKTVLENTLVEVKKENPLELLTKTKSELEEISLKASMDVDKDMNQVVDEYLLYMDQRLDFNKNVIPSPYPSVDEYTIGWLPGQLITIGARTSVGKTVIATQSAITACSAGKSVALFSLEMGEKDIMDRIISSMSLVELSAIRTRPLGQDEQRRFMEAVNTFKTFNLVIDDTPSVTLDYIRNQAIRLSQRPEGLDMIIIDYLQLITHVGRRGQTRQEVIAELSRAMKILSKQLQVPIMILVQLNRENKDDPEDRLPKIDDIRESGAIAQDSDIVLLIHRKLTSDAIDPKALFIIGKNRNGAPGKLISVRAALEYAMFIDDNDSVANEKKNAEFAEAVQDQYSIDSSESSLENDNFNNDNSFANDNYFEDDLPDFGQDEINIFEGDDF